MWVNTPNHPDGKVEWYGYHVAPTVPVQKADGSVQDMVIDPSMFDHPVTVDEWRDAQHDHPRVEKTRIGEPPPGAKGSGYWPGRDPLEGIDENARETMEEYKRLEGTRGIKGIHY
ncbi:MAG: protein-glutamine glutaminase family protein [Proteobacteria bacterium]|nr:protein-glutamine glutaminase family protein [Pseudomonadota bacterium]